MALGLGLPAVAAAQSAGDDQYADPFEEEPVQRDEPERIAGSPPTEAAQPPARSSAEFAGQTTASGELARTGFDLPILFVTGAVLLLSGVTVRRVVTRPPPAMP